MLQKDIGLIMAKTGINKDSEIVDAGGGSGSLCLSLANICKKITVYETHPEHHKVVQKNITLSGLNNVTLKHDDIYKGIKEKELDLITLDLPEPWQVVRDAEISGFLERNFFQSPRGPRIIRTKMVYQRADHASRIPDAGAYRVYGILQEDVNLLFTNHCRDYQNIQMLLHIPLL